MGQEKKNGFNLLEVTRALHYIDLRWLEKFVSAEMKFWIRKKGFETNPFNTCQQEIIVYNIDLIVVKAWQNPSQFHLACTF